MKIDVSPYELKTTKSIRPGSLLRVVFSDNSVGYADCHPWVELGDKPLSEQLKLLSTFETTPLTERSLYFAKEDAKARAERRSLLENRSIPKSHKLIFDISATNKNDIDQMIDQGFDYFKIKLGRDLKIEVDKLNDLFKNRKVKLRFDFNNRISRGDFEYFLDLIGDLIALVDYIEDPFTFDEELWAEMQRDRSISLAADHSAISALGKNHAAKVIIVKPAIESYLQLPTTNQRIIVTSYLDHPLGQVSAAWVASQIEASAKEVNGLNSHQVYEQTPFSRCLSLTGPSFTIPKGTGFGFDDLLKEVEWKPLI